MLNRHTGPVSISVVPVTPTATRFYRNKEYTYSAPVVGNLVAVNGTGYGDGIHRTYVVIKVFKTNKGDVNRCTVMPITNEHSPFDDPNPTAHYRPEDYPQSIKVHYKGDASHWYADNECNSWTFDIFAPFTDDFPHGR